MNKQPPLLSAALIRKMLPRRPADSHKGRNGHVVIVAGSRGMSGAAVLCARGALRAGAGLVTVAIIESERSAVAHQLPEALTLSLPETAAGVVDDTAMTALRDYLQNHKVSVLAVGPGLSIASTVTRVVRSLLQTWEYPLVLDADGINNVSLEDVRDHPGLILTPHPGEFARLAQLEGQRVQGDRVRLAENMARDHHLLCVLKGYRTVVTDGRKTAINPTGNPAMATGGMGDVLTGAIAALLAQGLKPWEAACAGAFLHGLAGNLARTSDRGLLATDVAEALPRALSKIGVR